jgi:protein phosphatase 1G
LFVEYFYNVIFSLEGFRKANPAMGASNSRDIRTEGGENVRIKYGAASMQGLGPKMEDAVSNLLVL